MKLDKVTNQHWPRLTAHADAWHTVLARGLGHEVQVLTGSGSEATCFLPLARVASPLFGRFLVSLPYLNSGGVCAATESDAMQLIDQAVALADEANVQYLELRHETPIEHPKLTVSRTDKVHMRLALPSTPEELMAGFKSKLRSQIKKSSESQLQVQWGGADLLSDFYDVFARNMRDLGTPVYSKRLFLSMIESFSGDAEFCVVRKGPTPVAAAVLIHHDEITEVPSASSLREWNPTGCNMWMYWQLLQRAVERGAKTFDFGRSSVGSGTYKFKEQWGAKAYPAVWQYYVRSGDPSSMRPDSPKKQKMIQIWTKLPVWFTKLIGPPIVRGIP
jgi:serine/alanine adding enzyme